jgi:hypothetical protein|uniref:hypothetical protein n=1 Tax=Cephaloticoccus sp. TaxID=1985742 RepID=UPI00404B9790
MKASPIRQGSNWWLAVVLAFPLVLGAVLLLSLRHTAEDTPVSLRQPDRSVESQLGLTRLVQEEESNLVAAEAHFLDPTPLFLPTEWNAGQNILPSSVLRDPGQMFKDYPSRLVFAETSMGLQFPDRIQVPQNSKDTINIVEERAKFQAIGRIDGLPAKLSARGGYLEVSLTGNGEQVLAEAVPEMPIPDGNWRPVELMGVVNAAGLVGRLTLVQSSGVVEIDAFYRDYLEKTLLIGARLKPGFYRISVGP